MDGRGRRRFGVARRVASSISMSLVTYSRVSSLVGVVGRSKRLKSVARANLTLPSTTNECRRRDTSSNKSHCLGISAIFYGVNNASNALLQQETGGEPSVDLLLKGKRGESEEGGTTPSTESTSDLV